MSRESTGKVNVGRRTVEPNRRRNAREQPDQRCLIDEVAVQFGIIDRHRGLAVLGETRSQNGRLGERHPHSPAAALFGTT